MAYKYWVYGEGTWGATGTGQWSTSSGGTINTSLDPNLDIAVFDSNSGSGFGNNTCSVDDGAQCQGIITPSTTGMTLQINGTLTSLGDVNLSNITVYNGAGYISLWALNRNCSLTNSNSNTLPAVRLSGEYGYTASLGSNIKCTEIDMQNTCSTNNYSLQTTKSITVGNNTSATVVNLGSSVITTPWFRTWPNDNVTASSATINIKYSPDWMYALEFYGGNKTYNTLNIECGQYVYIYWNNTFTTMSIIPEENPIYSFTRLRFYGGDTQTVTNFNISGKGRPTQLMTSGGTGNAAFYKASGAISADYIAVSNVNATGGATWKLGPHSWAYPDVGTGWSFAVHDNPGAFGAIF